MSTLLDVLRLSRSENVGPVTFCALIKRFGNARAALQAIPELSIAGGRKKPITLATQSEAEIEILAVEKVGGKMLVLGTPEYPPMLAQIYDPPPIITVLGNIIMLQKKQMIAIVGARNASANGCQFARKLAQDAGAKGFTVASGLARGIDTAAHVGSLASGTVAVMACGIGQIYPPENKALHDEIAARGCVISEQVFNALPHSRAFPGRNRIISGLSQGTVIVEAALKSGSLITAKYALEQNREVFAVPGSPMDPRCKGTNQLLKEGAHLCEGIEDVIDNLGRNTQLQLREAGGNDFAHLQNTSAKMVDDATRKAITSKLGFSPVQVDELLLQCGISLDIVSLVLLELELAGRLQRHPGHKVSLVANDAADVG